MADAGAEAAPAQQSMDAAKWPAREDEEAKGNGAGPSLESVFGHREQLLVKQTMRGCLQECLGCEAKSEFKVSAMDWNYINNCSLKEGAMNQPDELYILEESGCLIRCCCQDGRPMVLNVSQGGEAGGPPVVEYRKPMGCPVNFTIRTNDGQIDCPCCCMLPELTAVTPDGRELNKTRYACDLCLYVPKFMYSENGQDVYKIRPDTCCCGCCIMCKCGGRNCMQVPFYFFDPNTGEKIPGATGMEGQEPQITKVWAGLKKECCSTADNFIVAFPNGCTPERKAGLLGATMLVDFVFFEGRGNGE